MTQESTVQARMHAPELNGPDTALDCVSSGLSAAGLARRLAKNQARLQRRHTLRDVVRQYVNDPNNEVLARDQGRLTPLAMWVDVLGDRYLDEITTDEVAETLAMYAEQPVRRFAGKDKKTGQKIYREHGTRAASTVNRAKVVLSAVFAYAKDNSLLRRGHHSPTSDIRGTGFNAAELPDRAMSRDELEMVLAHAKTAPWPKLYLFVLMAASTGARYGELRQLRGRHLMLEEPTPKAVVGMRRTEKERAGTKNGAVKNMPLVPKVVAEIKRLGVPKEDEFLFPSKRFPNQPHDVAKSYKALIVKLPVKNKRLHDLRHTAGTMFANDGKSESQIAALLGHKTLSMVPRYTRVQAAAKAEAVKSSALWHLQ